MELKNKRKSIIISTLASILVSGIVFAAFFMGITIETNRLKQQERLNTMEKVVKYKSKLEGIVYSKIVLTQGYLAYIKANPNISEEETKKYLSYLIDPNDKLIKNISILKNTTIVWVYPLKGNENAIGKNLAEIPEQREMVLKAKNNLRPVFQGPIKLIQGGIGFISRIPITSSDGKYWGQMSVVILGDELMKEAGLDEKENDLDIALFNKTEYPKHPFWGNVDIMKKNPLTFDMLFNEVEWKIAIIPKGGWHNTTRYFFTWLVINALISIFIGILTFLFVYTRYCLKYQAIYDSLTGVRNRTFKDVYLKAFLDRAKRNNKIIALLLIDINDFKDINDMYGHKAGDEALKVIAKRLSLVCGALDLIIRIGGDEFLMVLSDIQDKDNIEKTKMRIHSVISEKFIFRDEKMELSVSIGDALYCEDGDDIDDVINVADNKMYKAKKILKHYKIPKFED